MNNKKVKWLDEMHDACAGLRNCAFHLEGLASGFYTTGNTIIGDELTRLAKSLYKCQETIHQGIGEKVYEQFHDAGQASYNMIKSVIAITKGK